MADCGYNMGMGEGGRMGMDPGGIANESFGLLVTSSLRYSYFSQFHAIAYVCQLMASYV